jgi:hypothetical protein
MKNDNSGRVKVCVDFIARTLDQNRMQQESIKFQEDYSDIQQVITQMSMYLHEFNFYPAENKIYCCEVAFFLSLQGERWNLQKKHRLTLEELYTHLIRHCQGLCPKKTTYAVIVTDNWNDDIATFWQPNIEHIKANGVIVEVHLLTGQRTSIFEL